MAMFCFASGLIIGFAKGWQLALILCASFPFLILSGFLITYTTQMIYAKTEQSYTEAGAHAEQAFSAIKTIKSLGGENHEQKIYDKFLVYARNMILKFSFFLALSVGIICLVAGSYYAAGYFFGALMIKEDITNPTSGKTYTIGDVYTIMFSIVFAGFSLGQAAPLQKAFVTGKEAAAKIFAVVDRKIRILLNDPTKKEAKELVGDIEFENVEFAFPTRENQMILKKINIQIKANTKVAIVGESG